MGIQINKTLSYGVIIFVLLLIVLTGCQQKQDAVKVGVIGPFSGEFASLGEWVRQGSEIGAQEVEQKYGVHVQLVYEDSGCSAKEMLTALNKLKSVDNVQIVTGFPCNPDVGAPWVQDNNMIMVSGGDNFGKMSENWYDARFPLKEAMGALGTFAYEHGARRTGVIHYENKWGELSEEGYAESFNASGGTIVGVEGIGDGVDFRTSLLKFKEAKADSVLMIYSNGADFVNQLSEMNMNVTKLADSQFESPRSITIGGKNLDGIFYVRAIDSKNSSAQAFTAAYQKQYGQIPDLSTVANHDAILIVGNALKQCGDDTNLSCLRTAIQATNGLPGASGTLTFDSKRWSFQTPQFMVKTFANGSFVNYKEQK